MTTKKCNQEQQQQQMHGKLFLRFSFTLFQRKQPLNLGQRHTKIQYRKEVRQQTNVRTLIARSVSTLFFSKFFKMPISFPRVD